MHKNDDFPGEAFSEECLRSIPGNAGVDVKELVQRWLYVFYIAGFGKRTTQGLSLVEISTVPNADEPTRQDVRVVLELVVTQDMINSAGMLHGSCTALLVDVCTTLPIAALSYAKGGDCSVGVSQNINIIYHAPAHLGDKLRLTNTSVTFGRRAWSARIEIWDMTHQRLVATATQIKMEPSASKL